MPTSASSSSRRSRQQPAALSDRPSHVLASMGNAKRLIDALTRDAAEATSSHDFGRDIIPSMLGRQPVFAHRFERSCVNTVDSRP